MGCLFIIMGISILFIYNNQNQTYTMDEIERDIMDRIYQSANGKNNVKNVEIEVKKEVSEYFIYVYSYEYKDKGESNNFVIYEKKGDKYQIHSDSILSFQFNDRPHNKGLQYIVLDGYVIIVGIVNNESADTYEIVSGRTTITDTYERNKYFIQEYILGNPNEMSITAKWRWFRNNNSNVE